MIAPEMYGINDYVRDVACDWAERGYFALAIDSLWRVKRRMVLNYDGARTTKRRTTITTRSFFPRSVPDLQSAIDALRALDGANGKVGIVGYCLGGTLAYMAAVHTDVDAAVGYYGSRIVEFAGDTAAIARPLLLHFGEDDLAIPPGNRDRVIAATAGNPRVTNVVHPHAQHAFANHLRADRYDAAATQHADELTSAFFRRELGS